jgi:hypothetical protein
MRPVLRLVSWIVAVLLAGSAGMVPGCASMGGGMHYGLDAPPQEVSALL